MNTYGERFRLTTYGESHGPAVGAVIDGCPAGVALDMEAIADALARRRTGAPRQEEDTIEWLSGLVDGITLGTPLAFVIHNRDARPEDYGHLEHLFRPGHADYTYQMKYGLRDHNGGGRASARETVVRVVAGAIARQLMPEVSIATEAVSHSCDAPDDTVGGMVRCRVTGRIHRPLEQRRDDKDQPLRRHTGRHKQRHAHRVQRGLPPRGEPSAPRGVPARRRTLGDREHRRPARHAPHRTGCSSG